jgi:hypothetical protein
VRRRAPSGRPALHYTNGLGEQASSLAQVALRRLDLRQQVQGGGTALTVAQLFIHPNGLGQHPPSIPQVALGLLNLGQLVQ